MGVRAQGLFGGPQQNTMAAALKAQGGAAIGQGIQVGLSGLAAGLGQRAARQERDKDRKRADDRFEQQMMLRTEMRDYQRSRQQRLDKEAKANRAADNERQDRRVDIEDRRTTIAERQQDRQDLSLAWGHQQSMAKQAEIRAQEYERDALHKDLMGDAQGAQASRSKASRFWGFAQQRAQQAAQVKAADPECVGYT